MEHITTLQQHIETRVRAGATKDAIKEQVLAVGWSEEVVDKAYADALVAVGVPVPTVGVKGAQHSASTLDIVINFFSFILLGITATALGTLYFQIINKYFPDALANVQDYYYVMYPSGINTDAVYYAIAALLVAYPLYYVVVRMWFKRFREDEAKTESNLTKWLTYLVLLGTSVTIVADLIAVLFTFFQGEITMRFFLKALTILVIAGMVFGFYFLERKKVQYRQSIPRKTFQMFGYALTGFVLGGITLGFFAAGTPGEARMRAFDKDRAEQLSRIAQCVDSYASEYQRLPDTLADLNNSSGYQFAECSSTDDPETGEPFMYRVVSPLMPSLTNSVLEGSVELCAMFSLASDSVDGVMVQKNKWYEHGVGKSCDTESISARRSTTY